MWHKLIGLTWLLCNKKKSIKIWTAVTFTYSEWLFIFQSYLNTLYKKILLCFRLFSILSDWHIWSFCRCQDFFQWIKISNPIRIPCKLELCINKEFFKFSLASIQGAWGTNYFVSVQLVNQHCSICFLRKHKKLFCQLHYLTWSTAFLTVIFNIVAEFIIASKLLFN